MFFRKIESEGLAHFSYMIGKGKEVAVIDPRRDVGVYIEEAMKAGMEIKYVFETHRNEDYIIGSMELSEKTGAKIYISGHEDLGHIYGEKIYDGDEIKVGELIIKGIHTPGHTLGHMSYALYEKDREKAYMVFTGDCLFMGDLGRTDFYGEENLEKMTGLLYDSIFHKLMLLGEDVLIFPAHGAGSACGDKMDNRPFSTLGYEKSYNEVLQVNSKEEFIQKFSRMRIKPRYFEKMEVYNVKGAKFVGENMNLKPLWIHEVEEQRITLIDIRSKEACFGGRIPNSIFLSKRNLSSYLGTLLTTDTPIAFVIEGNDMEKLEEIYWLAKRIGFDNIKGFLTNGNAQWESLGRDLEILPTISASEFLQLTEEYILLDIRKSEDINNDYPLKNLMNIPLQNLYKDMNKIPKEKTIYVICGLGDRSASAATYLKNNGYDARVLSGGLLTLKPFLSK